MNNRIQKLFKNKCNNILSIYFTAGHPKLEDTMQVIYHLEQAGVDMIEVGFPFSDPLADGPVIQKSNQQAIVNGMTLNILFNQLQSLRKNCSLPVILMGYLNPVLQFGEVRFIEECNKIGIDGIIIPDMPLNYYQEHLQPVCKQYNLSNILLITPETNESRIKEIDEQSEGFIYMVSSNSITGGNNILNVQSDYFNRIKLMSLKNNTIIGFGIHNNETFKYACQFSSGAIVGSAFIKYINEYGTGSFSIQKFINTIRL